MQVENQKIRIIVEVKETEYKDLADQLAHKAMMLISEAMATPDPVSTILTIGLVFDECLREIRATRQQLFIPTIQ